jgi:hypothetical protein
MQIDPAALSRTDSISSTTAVSSAAKATASTSGSTTQKSTKALISVPRLDLEPIYTELKAAIGDKWAEYKQATTHFLLGALEASQCDCTGQDSGLRWRVYGSSSVERWLTNCGALQQGFSTRANFRRASIM